MSKKTEPELLAWEVDIRSMTCIVFAPTKPKARWIAVKSYWDAFGHRKGEWPNAVAKRRPTLDSFHRKHEKQQAWVPEYVEGCA